MDYQEKLFLIQKWATQKPEFDTKFIDSVLQSILGGNELSIRQEMAIDRIISFWCIPIGEIADETYAKKIIPIFENTTTQKAS